MVVVVKSSSVLLLNISAWQKITFVLLFASKTIKETVCYRIAALLQCIAEFVAQVYHHLQGINYHSPCPSDLHVKLHLVPELPAGF